VARQVQLWGAVLAVCVSLPGVAAQRWLAPADKGWVTDGSVQAVALPHPNSGPTTITVAPDGRVWFTESSGNRIGRMDADGTNLVEFPLPHSDSSPRILALGGDGNLWFSEHTGNRMGRITPSTSPRRTAIRARSHWARTATSGSASSRAGRSVASRRRA